MKTAKKRRKIRLSRLLPVVVLCAVLAVLSVTTDLWARFLTGERARDEGTVASFVFRLQDGDTTRYLDLSEIDKPGDTAVYRFVLNNGEASAVSEVDQAYTVQVRAEGNMPLVCTLQRESEAPLEGNASVPIVERGELTAGQAETVHFTLTVSWPKEKNSEHYAGGAAVGRVILQVFSEQVD